jgi:hypothetical protein
VEPGQLPCGLGGAQDLNINAAAATYCMSFIRRLFKQILENVNINNFLNYHLIEFGVDPPSTRIRYNTTENMNRYKRNSGRGSRFLPNNTQL